MKAAPLAKSASISLLVWYNGWRADDRIVLVEDLDAAASPAKTAHALSLAPRGAANDRTD